MGICWYCHWGWPKPVADIYIKALKALDGDMSPLHFGPAHLVWEDENFDFAQSCLDEFEQWIGDHSPEDMDIVRQSLVEMADIPEEVWDVEPEDYDDEHPENYPPPDGVVMIRVQGSWWNYPDSLPKEYK